MSKKIFYVSCTIILLAIFIFVSNQNREKPLKDEKTRANYNLTTLQSDNQHFDYLTESNHFKIYFHKADEEIASKLIIFGENSYNTLVGIYKNFPIDKTTIYLFSTFDELKKLTSIPPFVTSSSGYGGFDTFPPLGDGVKIYLPEKDKKEIDRIEMQETFMLAHEISHRFFYHLYPNIRKPIRPNWLDEGLATYIGLESSQIYKTGYGFNAVFEFGKKREIFSLRLAYLDRLQEKNETLDLFYGTSATIIYFLCKNYGQDSLSRFLEEYNKTTDLSSSFLEVFGISMTDFEKKWLDFVQEAAQESKNSTDFYKALSI